MQPDRGETTPTETRTFAGIPLDAGAVGSLLALAAFFLVTISGRAIDLLPSPDRMFLVLLWPLVLVAFLWSGRPWIVVAYCIGGGVLLRWAGFPSGGSDVLPATREAIQVLLTGGNPYEHFYRATSPQGAPFPYPPFEILLHVPGYLVAGENGVKFTELVAAGGVMGVLGVLAARVSWVAGLPALALYAALPNLVNLTNDASNDTSTGAMLLFAVVAFARAADRRWDRGALTFAAVVAALALATKQTNLFVIALLAVYLWQAAGRERFVRFAATVAGVLALLSIPFLLMGPLPYLRSLTSFFGAHEDVYGWNIWVFARGMGWEVWDVPQAGTLNVVVILATLAVFVFLRYRSYTSAALAGVVVTLVALLTARWTTYAYFAFVAPVALALPVLAVREGLWQWVRPELPEAARGGDPVAAGLSADDPPARSPAGTPVEPETPPARQRLPRSAASVRGSGPPAQ